MVMYAGRVVEKGPVRDIFYRPQHPYTFGLLKSMPRIDEHGASTLAAIPGQPPTLQNLPQGCTYRERCPFAFALYRADDPALRPICPASLCPAPSCKPTRKPSPLAPPEDALPPQ